MKTRSAGNTEIHKSCNKQTDQTDKSKKKFNIHEKNMRREMESPHFDSTINHTKIDADHKTPVTDLKFHMLGLKIRSSIKEIIKVTMIVIAFLIIYKIIGAHDLWIQFLDTFDW